MIREQQEIRAKQDSCDHEHEPVTENNRDYLVCKKCRHTIHCHPISLPEHTWEVEG